MQKKIALVPIFLAVLFGSCAIKKDKASIVCLETSCGKISVRLYPETSKHKANFLKLVEKGFYDGVLFHRVIANFMIQAGDHDSKIAKPGASLGSGDVGYTIPAEFVYPKYYHKRGVLAAAREGDESNPSKASSGCQFYIVEGKTFSDEELDKLEQKKQMKLENKLFQKLLNTRQEEMKKYNLEGNEASDRVLREEIMKKVKQQLKTDSTCKFTQKQRNDYKTIGGAPHLDGEYSVFGEVIEGMDVVDRISKAEVDQNDRPIEDIKVLKVRIIK